MKQQPTEYAHDKLEKTLTTGPGAEYLSTHTLSLLEGTWFSAHLRVPLHG